jgi:hypothetical protein
MKKINFTVAFAIMLFGINIIAQQVSARELPTIFNYFSNDPLSFKSDTLDVHEIPQGKPVMVEFEYTNNFSSQVIISDVRTSCGCTVASYDKAPILPGKSGKITATYNAASIGFFTKAITVSIQGQPQKILTIKGRVI